MSRTSRFTSLALLLAALTGLFLLWPSSAHAQEPCEPEVNDFSTNPGYPATENGRFVSIGDWQTTTYPAVLTYDAVGDRLQAESSSSYPWGGYWEVLGSGQVTSEGDYISVSITNLNAGRGWLVVEYMDGTGQFTGREVGGTGVVTINLETGKTIKFVRLAAENNGAVHDGTIWFDDLTFRLCGTPNGLECDLVENADFDAADGWLLAGTAVITNGTLTLGPGDIADQNLTLTADRTYNAVISATDVTASTPLVVVLGTLSQSLTITDPGLYTATFATPSSLTGTTIYGMENDGSGTITLAFTCVSLQSSGQTGQECLAPTNGTFEDESGWNWYRGAEWLYPGKYASLPLADYGMIGTSETYTMPTLAVGEHLLLGFTARGLDDGGVVSGQITNGGSTVEFNYSTYEAEYSYEASLDALAEETGVQLSFVNPGDVITDVVSSADVVVDNICVFLANRGPNLPTPTDPDGIIPLDPGLQGFTSCGDLDGIWAGFGINMAQYRVDYAAGTSVWDPLGWVPWLISAIFVTLASWACFFFAAFLNLIDLIVYFLNSVMNIGNWLVRMWPAFVAWLSLWNDWLAGSLASIANAIGNTLAAWSNWIGDALWATSTTIVMTVAAAFEWLGNSLANISEAIGNTLAAWSEWIGNTLAGFSEALAAFLSAWSNWIAESLANLSNWIGATLATLWDWLASYFLSLNGLRIVINWLIDAWNAFLAALGALISSILELLIGIWNDSLWPFLNEAWAFISGMPATIASLLVDFVGAAWELLKTMFLWLWENVVSVAHTPLTFYYAFDSGINADPYGLVSCAGENFWCTFLSGVQLINQLIAHSTLYPIIIVGIILSTLWILWDNFRELFFSPIEIR